MDPVTLAASIFLGVEAVTCVFASWRFRVWYTSKGESDPYLGRLSIRNIRVGLGAALICVVIVYSLLRFALPNLELGALLPPIGALLIALPLAWMMWGPIADWLEVRK